MFQNKDGIGSFFNQIGFFSIAFVSLAAGECIAFRGGKSSQLPPVKAASIASELSIGYRINALYDDAPAGVKGLAWIKSKIEYELVNSGVFLSVAEANGQSFVLDIIVHERCGSTFATVTSVLATFTLGILPLYHQCEFDLQAILLRKGSEIKRYHFQDYETDVGWLFFAFVQPFVNSRWGSTIENLTRHLVREMVSDGSLRS